MSNNLVQVYALIYEAFCFDVAPMNRAPMRLEPTGEGLLV